MNNYSMKDYFMKVATENEITLTPDQLNQFQLFYDFLLEKNKVMNLTAITEMQDVVMKHFIDSISILKYYQFSDSDSVIDVGTGAGFPGIPLAIMCPNTKFTLMDSLMKRIRFLDECASICHLNNTSTVHSRAEELGQNPDYREKFTICVSRAVANLSVLLEYCMPFVKMGGYFYSYKSILAEDELSNSKHAQSELKCKLKNQYSFDLIGSDYIRNFLVFQKTGTLAKKYPRQAGLPKKKPL